MKKTENYNLGKPELRDFYDVNVQNDNMDIIDAELKKQEEHIKDEENPHKVTAKQVGLGNVNNTSDEDKPVSKATQEALNTKASVSDLTAHTGDTSNPHNVTKAQVGLGNVENKSSATIRGELTKSNVTNALGYTPINSSTKGSANGLAELDENGKVLASQLPSYVDDVLEYTTKSSFPTTGETSKIYIDVSTNLSYRWGGSNYIEISPSLALGETSSTAYRGDRGKVAYEHSQETSGNPHGVTASDVNAVAIGGNTETNTVTFTSSDVADGSATSWTSVTALASGISHATFFARVSQMFKNVRYLYKMLGTMFQSRGWMPNGATLDSLSAGVYSTNPNNLPSIGVPDGYSTYGSFIVETDNYTSFIYNDVYGNFATYNTNQGGWNKYYSQVSVDALINNSKVKSITIEDAVVTGNTIGNTSPFYGTGYTYYGCTAGNSRANIDTLISQGHTVLGGFISRGACNDAELANNVASLSGMVVDYNTYAGCPYQIVFVSNGYQTMHCKITILYI